MNVMLAIAVLAVAIPTCQMIGCEMSMCGTGMMMPIHHTGTTFGEPCGGSWLGSAGQIGVVPEFSGLLTALFAALGLAALLLPATRDSRQLIVVEANSPPDPISPRGERFRV